MKKDKLIIGTRGSELALWQANHFKKLLPFPSELKIIKTSGDKMLEIPLQGRVEKGFFTKEIEEKLIAGEIDIAVHSLKDLPTKLPDGLCVAAFLKRAAIEDLLVIREEWLDEKNIPPLKSGCVVGAGSLRRQALLKLYAPDSKAELLRGNVPTRLRKLSEGKYGAILIAKAGVERINADIGGFAVYELNPKIWLPAPGQGIIGVEARANDKEILKLLETVNDKSAESAAFIERKLLENFEGGCHTAFGAFAFPQGENFSVTFGIEDEEGHWRQKSVTGNVEMCISFKAPDKQNLQKLASPDKEGLCKRIR
ncbi:MAG: hydroxymethylbilane synthase [Myxococcota bacterium]